MIDNVVHVIKHLTFIKKATIQHAPKQRIKIFTNSQSKISF